MAFSSSPRHAVDTKKSGATLTAYRSAQLSKDWLSNRARPSVAVSLHSGAEGLLKNGEVGPTWPALGGVGHEWADERTSQGRGLVNEDVELAFLPLDLFNQRENTLFVRHVGCDATTQADKDAFRKRLGNARHEGSLRIVQTLRRLLENPLPSAGDIDSRAIARQATGDLRSEVRASAQEALSCLPSNQCQSRLP